ncbi:MAG TPA: heavy metal sensor histidine kinase [Pirellulales bacterium]|nr:heavy metal sensor histidine kinase [Pirellulales bacterium]
MCSANRRPWNWSLRTRLTLWTTSTLLASLLAGFAWAHHNLRAVLEARNDAFLEQKLIELTAVVRDVSAASQSAALEAEIRREVAAYDEGFVVVWRRKAGSWVMPSGDKGRRLAARLATAGLSATPTTIECVESADRYRAVRTRLAIEQGPRSELDLALSLRPTEADLAQFDRRVAAGGAAFFLLAVAGGLLLSRQALRPVAASIATAQRLNPQELSARLPRSGADDELDRLAATINDLLDRLAADHAQIIRFTADASHELRSPLGAMRAAVEVALQQSRSADEYREVLASLGEQCERLTALVNKLLLLARADAGQAEVRFVAVDLAALVEEVAELYQPLAEDRGVQLVWRTQSGIEIEGDPGWLRQLAINLIDNAIKFAAPGGCVTLRLETAGDHVRFAVSDTGIGIAPDRLPHVFERFYQVDAARSAGGHGLGLSICRWIAQIHGGTIDAESRLGEGTTFTVRLPKRQGRGKP